MFKLVPAPQFTSTVRLSVAGVDAGAPLQITWRHKGARALAAYFAASRDRADDASYLGEVIVGWHGVHAEDGSQVPYSPEALAALLDAYPAAAAELLIAYRHELADARAKN